MFNIYHSYLLTELYIQFKMLQNSKQKCVEPKIIHPTTKTKMNYKDFNETCLVSNSLIQNFTEQQ